MDHTQPTASPYAITGPARSRRTLADGTALFRHGDPVEDMYFIERGSLRLQRHLADGRLVPIGRSGPGETIAEASLFADHYHCDCVADGPAIVAVYPRAAVRAALRDAPDQAAGLLRHYAAQVQGLRSRIEILTQHTAEARVVAWLALCAEPATGAWTMDRTWKAVAEEIGLTHEALYRALARLERAGRIARDGPAVRLLP